MLQIANDEGQSEVGLSIVLCPKWIKLTCVSQNWFSHFHGWLISFGMRFFFMKILFALFDSWSNGSWLNCNFHCLRRFSNSEQRYRVTDTLPSFNREEERSGLRGFTNVGLYVMLVTLTSLLLISWSSSVLIMLKLLSFSKLFFLFRLIN